MVVGANGTGKSTLLNAICLGLGGEPKLLGRADDLRAFIMHGKDKAEIELELAPLPGKKPHILRRMIDRHRGSEKGRGRGASTFYINDEKTNIQAVRELVQGTYNIQIDNLCTFLPQDKVGNFSGFSNQDRLLETEKTLPSNQYFYKIHQELIEKEAAMESDITNVQSIRDTLKNKKHDFERLELGKAREEERAQAEAQVDLLQKKRLWLQFEMLRDEGMVLKEEKLRLKKELDQATAEIQPLEDKHNQMESLKKELGAQQKTTHDQQARATKELQKQREKFEKHDEQIDGCIARLREIEDESHRKQKNYDDAMQRVETLLEQQKGHPDKAEVENELREAKESFKAAKKEYESAKRDIRQVQSRFRDLEEKSGNLQAKIAKMNDKVRQRREHVFRSSKNLGTIAKWVDDNREMFRRPVWGPIAVEVETRSKNTAAFLEYHVPNNILNSFVVETEEDRKLLFSEVREKLGIPVNVISVQGKQLEQNRIYSDQKMKVLKKEHGVQCYLDQTFSAPDPVTIALQVWASVHKVLVGDEKTQKSVDNKNLKGYLTEPDAALNQRGLQRSCVFTSEGDKSYRHTTNISGHSGEPFSRVDDIGPAKMLAPGDNPAMKEKAEAELAETQNEIRELHPTMQQKEHELKDLEKNAQQCNTQALSKKSELEALTKFLAKLDRARNKAQEAKDNLEGDDTPEKKELVKQIIARLKNGIAAIRNHGQQQEEIMQHTAADAGITVNRTVASNAERAARYVFTCSLTATEIADLFSDT